MPDHPVSVLYVCTANICRSPFAEILTADWSDPGALRVSSAGTHAEPGRMLDPLMQAELERRGVSATDHLSTPLSRAAVRAADVVLTMTADQRRWILADLPACLPRVYTLRQFVAATEELPADVRGRSVLSEVGRPRPATSQDQDVVDPYGHGPAATAAAATLIASLVQVTVDRLCVGTTDHPSVL